MGERVMKVTGAECGVLYDLVVHAFTQDDPLSFVVLRRSWGLLQSHALG